MFLIFLQPQEISWPTSSTLLFQHKLHPHYLTTWRNFATGPANWRKRTMLHIKTVRASGTHAFDTFRRRRSHVKGEVTWPDLHKGGATWPKAIKHGLECRSALGVFDFHLRNELGEPSALFLYNLYILLVALPPSQRRPNRLFTLYFLPAWGAI